MTRLNYSYMYMPAHQGYWYVIRLSHDYTQLVLQLDDNYLHMQCHADMQLAKAM